MGETKEALEKDDAESSADGRKLRVMGYKASISKIIEEVMKTMDAASESGKTARALLKSVDKDMEDFEKNPDRSETLLKGKLAILNEVLAEETAALEAHIHNKIASGGRIGYPETSGDGGELPKL
jgi:hypothetical protein